MDGTRTQPIEPTAVSQNTNQNTNTSCYLVISNRTCAGDKNIHLRSFRNSSGGDQILHKKHTNMIARAVNRGRIGADCFSYIGPISITSTVSITSISSNPENIFIDIFILPKVLIYDKAGTKQTEVVMRWTHMDTGLRSVSSDSL